LPTPLRVSTIMSLLRSFWLFLLHVHLLQYFSLNMTVNSGSKNTWPNTFSYPRALWCRPIHSTPTTLAPFSGFLMIAIIIIIISYFYFIPTKWGSHLAIIVFRCVTPLISSHLISSVICVTCRSWFRHLFVPLVVREGSRTPLPTHPPPILPLIAISFLDQNLVH